MGMSVKDPRGDDILYGFLNMLQPEAGPRVNMDTVLLAGFTLLKDGERAAELGCAHGAVSLILAKRHPAARVEGIDIDPGLIGLARENARRNGLDGNAAFEVRDLREARGRFAHQSFDVIAVNPPYEDPGFGRRSESAARRVARQGESCTLADVCAAARYLLKNKGRLYMVMRALRLAETMAALQSHGLAPRELMTVHPAPGSNASVFLVGARRGGGPALAALPPLYICDARGRYTEELLRYYRPEPPRA